MNIIFYGNTEPERVPALAEELAKNHTVTILRPRRRDFGHVAALNGVQVVHGASFNPEQPGGRLYLWLGLVKIWRPFDFAQGKRPDVVHIHGWQAARLSGVLARLVPRATLIWTVDTIPEQRTRGMRRAVRAAQQHCHAIVASTRSVQYQLLTQYGVRAEYIPDGYRQRALPDVPAKRWNLRKGQYVAATVRGAAEARWIAEAYAKLHTKKKLIIATPPSAAITRLKKKYRCLRVIEPLSGRSYYSFLRQAAVVIAASQEDSTEDLLQVMDGGRAIVAANYPLHQEVLGTSAQFAVSKDGDGLRDALDGLVTNTRQQKLWGRKAQKRAQAHFTQRRIAEEYTSLYHYPLVRSVPIDSVVPRVHAAF